MIYSDATARFITLLEHDLPQGIVLTGPVGAGLKTTAQTIARSHTQRIVVVEPDAKGTIGIDTIRELYALGSSKGGLTIFVIDDADAMGREAQNALLKLLEEPVASLRFILTTHTPERLLPTIRSRVEQYNVTPLTSSQSSALLDELRVTDATKRAQLSFIADGLPAALTRYIQNDQAFAARSATVRDARQFLQGSREDRLLLAARYKDRLQALNLVHDVLTLLRRAIEASPKPSAPDSLDAALSAEVALVENASVRLTLTSLALTL